MKYIFAFLSLAAMLFSAACTQSPEKLMATANKYHENKRYKEASILYQKVITKDKTNAEVKLSEIYLAIYASDTRKYKSMLNDVRDLSSRISAHAPNSFEAYRIQGLLNLSEKNLDKALEDFQK